MRKSAIHQIMPGFFYGDALGNQARRIRELVRSWGYRSQVYAQYRDDRLEDPGKDYRLCPRRPDDVVIYHYGIGSPMTQFVRQLPARIVPYYHNVTPPDFLRGYNEPMVALLEQGRREVAVFRDANLALAASEYNRQEMLDLGFRRSKLLPYFITLDALQASAESPAGLGIIDRYSDGVVNILFVGRLVPNKRQDDLIRAFHAYHRLVNPNSRLLLVGSDASAPGYRLELEVMVAALGLEDRVHMPGPVGPREGLGGYYRVADLFLSMSEHEGFCIPLVEAMAFDLPVVAYRSTGIPYAMGGAGVLLSDKRYAAIAELIEMLIQDRSMRQQVVERQHRRLKELTPDRVAERLRAIVEQLIEREAS